MSPPIVADEYVIEEYIRQSGIGIADEKKFGAMAVGCLGALDYLHRKGIPCFLGDLHKVIIVRADAKFSVFFIKVTREMKAIAKSLTEDDKKLAFRTDVKDMWKLLLKLAYGITGVPEGSPKKWKEDTMASLKKLFLSAQSATELTKGVGELLPSTRLVMGRRLSAADALAVEFCEDGLKYPAILIQFVTLAFNHLTAYHKNLDSYRCIRPEDIVLKNWFCSPCFDGVEILQHDGSRDFFPEECANQEEKVAWCKRDVYMMGKVLLRLKYGSSEMRQLARKLEGDAVDDLIEKCIDQSDDVSNPFPSNSRHSREKLVMKMCEQLKGVPTSENITLYHMFFTTRKPFPVKDIDAVIRRQNDRMSLRAEKRKREIEARERDETPMAAHGRTELIFEMTTIPDPICDDVVDGDTIKVYVRDTSHYRDEEEGRRKGIIKKDPVYETVPFDDCLRVRSYWIRLRGIDAPEHGQPCFTRAKNRLSELLVGKVLRIQVYDIDKYDRHVGDIYVGTDFIQQKMLEEGLAWHYRYFDGRRNLEKWANEARIQKRGLWFYPRPILPYYWRRGYRRWVEEAKSKWVLVK